MWSRREEEGGVSLPLAGPFLESPSQHTLVIPVCAHANAFFGIDPEMATPASLSALMPLLFSVSLSLFLYYPPLPLPYLSPSRQLLGTDPALFSN